MVKLLKVIGKKAKQIVLILLFVIGISFNCSFINSPNSAQVHSGLMFTNPV